MSGVLHPVGPEPAQIYWIRRGLVFVVMGLLLALVVGMVSALSRGSGATIQPGAQPSVPAPAPTPGASISSYPAPQSSPTAAKPAGGTPTVAPSGAGKSGTTGKSSGTGTTKSTPVGPVACTAAALRPTLTGKQSLKVKKGTTFELSLINGGKSTCLLTVSPANFTLTIRSGKDRIWSSADCATAVKVIRTKVAAEADLTWTMDWNGRRSAKGCKTRPEIPGAGTYIATAAYAGADPVTLRMVLHG